VLIKEYKSIRIFFLKKKTPQIKPKEKKKKKKLQKQDLKEKFNGIININSISIKFHESINNSDLRAPY
jgi:hypothetical protein